MTEKTSQKEIARRNYFIAEDLKLIAEKYRYIDVDYASEVNDISDFYLARSKTKLVLITEEVYRKLRDCLTRFNHQMFNVYKKVLEETCS